MKIQLIEKNGYIGISIEDECFIPVIHLEDNHEAMLYDLDDMKTKALNFANMAGAALKGRKMSLNEIVLLGLFEYRIYKKHKLPQKVLIIETKESPYAPFFLEILKFHNAKSRVYILNREKADKPVSQLIVQNGSTKMIEYSQMQILNRNEFDIVYIDSQDVHKGQYEGIETAVKYIKDDGILIGNETIQLINSGLKSEAGCKNMFYPPTHIWSREIAYTDKVNILKETASFKPLYKFIDSYETVIRQQIGANEKEALKAKCERGIEYLEQMLGICSENEYDWNVVNLRSLCMEQLKGLSNWLNVIKCKDEYTCERYKKTFYKVFDQFLIKIKEEIVILMME